MPETRYTSFPALSVYLRVGISLSASETNDRYFLPELVIKVYICIDSGSGRLVRRCCVNFQCRGVLLIWIIVGQGPIALAIGAGGGCLDISFLSSIFSLGDGPI